MMERGRKEGLEEGRTKGLKEGQAKGVLEALETRFGEAGEGARKRVTALTDEGRLHQAHRLAITAPALEEFLATF